jgi:RNA polymerase sigma-70 factor (ECF subfamily)
MATEQVAARREADREADAELLRAVLAGDTTAYRGLVEKYQGRVYAMVYGMLRNREDARDVTQEAFVKAYHNLDGFRLDSSFYTWLYRIAMNLAIDLVRKRKRQKQTSFEDGIATKDEDGGIAEHHHEDGPRRALERKQLYARIMDALEQLPEDQKQVVLLRELEGLSYKEIAEVMEIPEGTVMSRLFYARKKLQKLLAEDKPR